MRLEDWREWPAERVAALVERQRGRWLTDLAWDPAQLFALVEQARREGQLPGLVAVEDDGTPAGWCYATLQGGQLFIGGLHGDRAEVVRALLDAVLLSAEAAYARGYRCFLYPESPAVAAALARKRFDIQLFPYLNRPLDGEGASGEHAVRPWTTTDLPETARLLARAYAGARDGRCFAPSGRLDEWASYVAQIVRTPACGTWADDESLVYDGEGGSGGLGGALLATRLSADTTHVAQVAVDPALRGRGIARALLDESAARARASGARRQTLLVAESNRPARELYQRLGFTPVSHFLYAERARISRVAAGLAWSAPDAETA